MRNTVQAQVQRAHPRSRIHVQQRHRSGYPCRILCKYKYSLHAHVDAPTHNRCIAQAAHAEHCTRSRKGCTSTHAHSRTTGASLRRPMPNTVHTHVRGARSTLLACNGYIAQATHNRYTTLTAHADYCVSMHAQHGKYTNRSVHAERRTRTYTHTHDDGYTARAAPVDRCTHTHKTDTRPNVHHSGCTCRTRYRTHTRVKYDSQVPL